MIRDVMQTAGLEGFAEFGIVVFVLAFIMILTNAFFGMKKDDVERMRHLPLEGEEEHAESEYA